MTPSQNHRHSIAAPDRPRGLRRLWRVPSVVLMAVTMAIPLVGVQALGTGGASADPTIASDQAQITQIQSQVQADNSQINTLAEQFDEATTRVTEDQSNVKSAQAKLDAAKDSETSTEDQLRTEAVNAYIAGGNSAQLDALVGGSSDDLAVRGYYVDSATNEEQSTVSSLKEQQHEIAKQQAALAAALAVDQSDVTQVESSKAAATQAVANENAVLSQVKGNLASLYAQAQAALRQQQAAAAAAAAAAAQGGGNGGGSFGAGNGYGVSGLPPPPNPQAAIAVRAAEAQIGKPYIWGGSGPEGFDCSGLTMYAWGVAGVGLAHGSIDQYYETTRISPSELEPGDLVFYSPPGEPALGHVSMYVGNGDVVAADNEGQPIDIESMYYVGPPVGFGRVN